MRGAKSDLFFLQRVVLRSPPSDLPQDLHSAKGGAVETGCSGLHDVMYQFTI